MTQHQAKVVRFTLPLGSVISLVDLVADDPDVPPMAAVPFRPGVPGMVIADLPKGTTIMVGWSGGDPTQPYCCLPGGGEHVGSMTLNSDSLALGGDVGAEPTIKGTSYRTAQSALHQSWIATLAGMASASTGPLAPLAAGFTALATALTTFEAQQATFLATNVKVK